MSFCVWGVMRPSRGVCTIVARSCKHLGFVPDKTSVMQLLSRLLREGSGLVPGCTLRETSLACDIRVVVRVHLA
jgi:hypothetical protein